MTQLFLFLQLHGTEIMQAVTSVISAASIVANFTKTDTDNKAVGAVSTVINFLAANFFVLKTEQSKVNL